MAQKAMEEYLNIKYSKEEGILGFHRDLVMWAGRLAQYPDNYSFKRRIMNGLPSDCLYHLTMCTTNLQPNIVLWRTSYKKHDTMSKPELH